MGAAGRDFHNFNTVYRDDERYTVVAFTATQIPEIAGRRYPPVLAGTRYPDGIPIVEESELAALIGREAVNEIAFAYSDISHLQVMHHASLALAAGCDFVFHGPRSTMVRATVPVIAISAVRTGCGKSPTTRLLAQLLKGCGLHTVVIRHPMPYGDLARQAVQRFASSADLDAAQCTVEEREEGGRGVGHVHEAACDFDPVDEDTDRYAPERRSPRNLEVDLTGYSPGHVAFARKQEGGRQTIDLDDHSLQVEWQGDCLSADTGGAPGDPDEIAAD